MQENGETDEFLKLPAFLQKDRRDRGRSIRLEEQKHLEDGLFDFAERIDRMWLLNGCFLSHQMHHQNTISVCLKPISHMEP